MPAPPPDARATRAVLTHVRPTGDDGVVLRVALPEPSPELRGARFYMLRREGPESPAIPRPFSVYRRTDAGELEFLIKVMGRGTRALAEAPVGTELLAVGPLGHGWPTLDGDGAPWVMVGGGIGSVPFYMGIEQALVGMDGAAPVAAADVTFVYGGRTAGLLYDIEEFERLGVRVIAATDDGSAGFRGNVVQAIEHEWETGGLPRDVRFLACGPDPMMHAVARLARAHDLPCWLSLETYMGCGIGICNGCSVPTAPDGPLGEWPVAKCCVEGPVFAADAIVLD